MKDKVSPAEFIDNPDWASFLPEVQEPSRRRRLPSHEDCSRLDVEAAAEHVAKGGTLGAMPGYEERPGQIAMLKAVARAFNAREHLMIEAGTGVGKSLAYLVPSILWAHVNDTPVVVATATRNLQSQLIDSDIPKALKVLGDGAADFKVALLKGRANYLCLRAVDELFAPGFWTMSAEDQKEMPRFIEWLKSTPDGDLDTYDGLQRGVLACSGEDCSGRRCRFHSRCFVRRARKAASAAHLVVANHALVLADAFAPGAEVLPPHGRLVLDEAHNLESGATDHLSSEFSVAALMRILSRLQRGGRGRKARPSGLLASVDRQLRKGAVADGAAASHIASLVMAAAAASMKAVDAAEATCGILEGLLSPAGEDQGPVRYKTADGVRYHSLHGLFREYGGEWSEEALLAARTRMESEIAGLVNVLHDLRDSLADAVPGNEVNFLSDLSAQADAVATGLVEFANEAEFVTAGERDSHAYWAERAPQPRRKRPALRLVAAPLSVAEELRESLYGPKDSVVLSSATLRVGNDFKYMTRRLGCQERFQALVAESPFDYFRQSLVVAPDCLPDPSANPSGYAEALASIMGSLFKVTRGRALVLFTSYEMMNAVASRARESLEAEGIELFVQGEGHSREAMTRALRRAGGTGVVLFGAQSFWEGVDVAGEALSCVVLARLPFAQVRDPIVEARAEMIERGGGSSFREYVLPEAVIRFRQGFGRLIRTKTDRGVVVVTDPRLMTKSYGATFRKSIPASVHAVTDMEEMTRRVKDFLA